MRSLRGFTPALTVAGHRYRRPLRARRTSVFAAVIGVVVLIIAMLGLTPATATKASGGHAAEESPGGSVVGGNPTTLSEHRYAARVQVPISRTTVRRCTGSVIDRRWILTAAHCVDDGRPVTVFVYNGSARPTEVIIHPEWNGDAGDGHDLALLRVPSSATRSVLPPTKQNASPSSSGSVPPARVGTVAPSTTSQCDYRAMQRWSRSTTHGGGPVKTSSKVT